MASYHVSQGVGNDDKDRRPRRGNDHDEANSFGCVLDGGRSWNRWRISGAVSPPPPLLVSASSPRLQSVLA